jgi:hypothetical protein
VKSLEGAPKKIGDGPSGQRAQPYCIFDCSNTSITTLEGGPQEIGKRFPGDQAIYRCNKCNNLINFIGAPEKIDDFCCGHLNVKSLDGFPKEVKTVYADFISNCGFTSDDIKAVCKVENHVYMF